MDAPAQEVARPWEDSQLGSVTKKQLVEFLQQHGNNEFLQRHRLNGKVANITKCSNKDALDAAYKELFEIKAFRTGDDDKAAEERQLKREQERKQLEEKEANEAASASSSAPAQITTEAKGFKIRTLSKGDKTNFPKRGDTVKVRYKGMLEDGKVFDSNTGKGKQSLQFKVGQGKVIRGWDEGLLEMSVGEKAQLTISPAWAYGAKGIPGTIPPNATLIFEVELEAIL